MLAFADCASRPAAAPPSPPDVEELGVLGMPAVVVNRDGGTGVMAGGKMLWLFGDTLMTTTGADGFSYRTSTAAWGDGAGVALQESLDSAGAPFELLPYTPDELAYNRAGGPSERYALWPGCAVLEPDGSVLFVYKELKVHPGFLDYEAVGVGIAHLTPGATVATREPGLLFRKPEPSFADGGFVDGGFYYLYAIAPVPGQLDSTARVARARLDHAADRGAWTFWDGSGWSAYAERAAVVMHGPGGALSVAPSAHVGGFLAVYGGILSNDVWYRTASRPEGPWTDARKLFTTPIVGKSPNYCVYQHPELSTDGGRTLVVSYSHPMENLRGEVHLVRVRLPR